MEVQLRPNQSPGFSFSPGFSLGIGARSELRTVLTVYLSHSGRYIEAIPRNR
jgi:hypothetical protein